MRLWRGRDNVLEEYNSYFIIFSFFCPVICVLTGLGEGKPKPKERVLFLKGMSMPEAIASITVVNSLGVTGKLYSERNCIPKSNPL